MMARLYTVQALMKERRMTDLDTFKDYVDAGVQIEKGNGGQPSPSRFTPPDLGPRFKDDPAHLADSHSLKDVQKRQRRSEKRKMDKQFERDQMQAIDRAQFTAKMEDGMKRIDDGLKRMRGER